MGKINISIDGHSSSGKSSIAKGLAEMLHYKYVNTGAMYRAVTYYCIREGMFDSKFDYKMLDDILDNIKIEYSYDFIKDSDLVIINSHNISSKIRTIEVTDNVSFISKIKKVRDKLVAIQRIYAKDKGVVMEGRDIGTVVLEKAEVKFFINADLDIRAKRRLEQLKKMNIEIDLEELKVKISKRDKIDSEREISPIKVPKGAFVITNNLDDLDSIVLKAYNLVNKFI